MKYLMLCIALATLVTPSRADELFNNSPVWNAVDTMYRLPDKFSDDSTVTLFTFYGCPTCTRVADWLNRNSEVQNINAVHVHVDVYSEYESIKNKRINPVHMFALFDALRKDGQLDWHREKELGLYQIYSEIHKSYQNNKSKDELVESLKQARLDIHKAWINSGADKDKLTELDNSFRVNAIVSSQQGKINQFFSLLRNTDKPKENFILCGRSFPFLIVDRDLCLGAVFLGENSLEDIFIELKKNIN